MIFRGLPLALVRIGIRPLKNIVGSMILYLMIQGSPIGHIMKTNL